MKTTVDIRDDLFLRAKQRAVALRRPLRELIEQGLQSQLEEPKTPSKAGRKRLRWVTVPGGLPPGVDLADREIAHARFGRKP